MAISFVAQTAGSAAATTSTTFSFTASSGNLCVIFVGRSGDSITGALSGVTDSAAQTWTLAATGAVSPTGGGIRPNGYGQWPYGGGVGTQVGGQFTHIECWYIANTANITTITLNSSFSQIFEWNVSEWSGVALTSPVDVASSAGHSSSGTVTTPGVTITQTTDLVLAAFQSPWTVPTFSSSGSTPTTGWTALTNFDQTGNASARASYQVMVANGSYDAAWTFGSNQPAGALTVAFQPPAVVTASPGTAGVTITTNEPVTGSGLAGFSGIQGIGIQGASVQGLQGGGSVSTAPAGLATVTVTSPASIPTLAGNAPLTNVTVTADPPLPQVTAQAGTAQVTVTAQSAIQTEAAAGQATVTVTANGPTVTTYLTTGLATTTVTGAGAVAYITANAGQAQVAVNAEPPAGFGANPGLATVTVTADQPTASVTATAGLATVTATANPPSFPTAPTLATVTVSANNPGSITVTAAAGLADPAAQAFNPTTTVTAAAGLATVTVTANNVPEAVIARPGEGTVIVTANNVVGTNANAGQAQVSVTANGAVPGVKANAGLASVAVTANNISKPITPGTAQVTVTGTGASNHITTAAEMAYGFAAAINAGTTTPLPITPVNGLCLFETPQVRDRPPYLPDSTPREIMLWRHFENRLRGVNVWKRNDGTYCVDTVCNYEAAQTHPAAYFSDDPIGPDLTSTEQGLSDSNVNYPWNPYPGSTNSEIPGSFAYNVNWNQQTQDFILNPYLVRWWQGGALNIILQSEAIDLTIGGFGDCITDAPPGSVYTAHSYKGGMNQ